MATNNREHPTSSNSPRVVRVFVSSTFRDMQAEREELVKRVFPQLRKLCESRGVIWGEVDLRWGISDEQKAEGKVLPICLAEIQRCRPYFIGLLGQRYGWIPDEISPELLAAEPWLNEHLGRSVTELEILHGVLNDPQMTDNTFFYLRNPAYLDTLTTEERTAYEESPSSEEVQRLGREEAERRASERRDKLERLKSRLKESGLPVRENYTDPKALGQMVLRDLTEVIDRLYPEGANPDPLDREWAGHEDFARARAIIGTLPGRESGTYIGRQEYFDTLDAHAAGGGPPLVVLGESGSGKSALLANWTLRFGSVKPTPPVPAVPQKISFWGRLTGKRPSESQTSPTLTEVRPHVIRHFVGATASSTDWAAMLRRLIGEMNRHFDIGLEIPDNPDALRSAFGRALHLAAAKGRLILMIDALDQLEDREGAPDLVWLPAVIPTNIRLVLSTLPGRPLAEIEKRGWPTLAIQPLTVDERRQMTIAYLDQYRKSLGNERVARIAEVSQTANPLYLKALLEELRLWGNHETLDQQIDTYLSAPNVEALYERILARYERDYERDRPGLVCEAMSLLWGARRGLSEIELLDLLGTGSAPLPRAFWSPLYLAAEQSLVNRLGLIGFFHDYLRRAVEARYLANSAARHAIHKRLADYFQSREWGSREVDELPWQLAQSESWQWLYDLLRDSKFLTVAWKTNQYEVKARWTEVETHSSLRLVEAYRPVINAPSNHADLVWALATLLADTGHPKEALSLRQWLVERFRQNGDKDNLQASLGNQALILHSLGKLKEAVALYQEQEQICLDAGNKAGLEACLGNQANILYSLGDLNRAMALYKEQEHLCRELNHRDGLRRNLGNQANVLFIQGELDEALDLHKKEERISRELGSKDGLQASLGNQALILYRRGDLDNAMALYLQQESICRELGDRESLGASLGNQALILKTRGDLDRALTLHREEERICRELGNLEGLQSCLGNQADILFKRGEQDQAMAHLKEGEQICRAQKIQDGLQRNLGSQGNILKEQGKLDQAVALYKEEERICREMGDKDGLGASLGNQAVILKEQGKLEEASALHKEEESICREVGNKEGLAVSLGNQALLFTDRNDLDGALALFQQQENIWRELGQKAKLQHNLGDQANIFYLRGDLDGALALYRQQEQLCRAENSKDSLQASLGNQAVILYRRMDLNGAMSLYKEKERICRETGDNDGVATSLGNQALILKALGDLNGAMVLHKKEEGICRQLGNQDGLQATLGNQAVIHFELGDLDRSLTLNQEVERICRQMGNDDGVQRSLGNQANVFFSRGDMDKARSLYQEQEHICRNLGNFDSLQRNLGNQANILKEKGDLNGAFALNKEKEHLCRELGNQEGLVFSLRNQAVILLDSGRARDALEPAEEAYRVAIQSGMTGLAQRLRPLLDHLGSQIR